MRKNTSRVSLIAALSIFSAYLFSGCSVSKADTDNPHAEQKPPATVEMCTVGLHSMENIVVAQGTLFPAAGADAQVSAAQPGRVKALYVREGDHVYKGQIIALMDNLPQQAQAGSAAEALAVSKMQAKQSYVSARAAATDQKNSVLLYSIALQSAKSDFVNSVKLAKTQLETAKNNLSKLRNGSRPQEISIAKQSVAQAQATRDRAADNAKRYEDLYKKGFTSKNTLDQMKTDLAVDEAALKSAKQQLSLILAGPRLEDIQAAELQVQQAQQSLQDSQTSGALKVAQARQSLQQAQQSALQVEAKQMEAQAAHQTVAQKQADLAAAEATARYGVVRSPLTGIVFHRNMNPGDFEDTTNPVVPLLEIIDSSRLVLKADLPASQGLKVQVGMPVHVLSADIPNKEFPGKVSAVGQIDPQTNLMRIHIAIENGKGLLRPGLFVSAYIILHTYIRAIVVPKQAVITRDGSQDVFVIDKTNIARLVKVQLGVEQNGLVQIVAGLQPAENVALLGQYELTDGEKVQAAAHDSSVSGGNIQ